MKLNKQQLMELYAEQEVFSNKGINWKEIFENEEELLKTMEKLSEVKYFKGNVWLTLVKTAKEKGWTLTSKQLRQVKRNAWLVAKLANYNDSDYDYIFEG